MLVVATKATKSSVAASGTTTPHSSSASTKNTAPGSAANVLESFADANAH